MNRTVTCRRSFGTHVRRASGASRATRALSSPMSAMAASATAGPTVQPTKRRISLPGQRHARAVLRPELFPQRVADIGGLLGFREAEEPAGIVGSQVRAVGE